MAPPKALLGLHRPDVEKTFAHFLRSHGYQTYCSKNLQEMLALCGQEEYELYLMDLNFGMPAGLDITPAREVYRTLQERGVEGLERKFYGTSGHEEVVEMAQSEGIPAILKDYLADKLKERFWK